MKKSSFEERLVELESRLAFQDNTIEELNGVIISQQQQLDRLEKEIMLLGNKLSEMMALPEGADGDGIY